MSDPLREGMRAGRFAEGLTRAGTAAWTRVANMTPEERAAEQEKYATEYAARLAYARSWRGRWERLCSRLGFPAEHEQGHR